MRLTEDVREQVECLIREILEVDQATKVHVGKITVSEATGEIRIVVDVDTSASAEELANRYFGLTSRVRKALGEAWNDYFPIITPRITQRTHA